MSNPYHQFNIRPRLTTRLLAVQPNHPSNDINNTNFHNPSLRSVGLLPPTVAYAGQQLYRALPSDIPVIVGNETVDSNAVGQMANDQWRPLQYPRIITHSNTGMTVMPIMPIDVANRPFQVHQPRNVPNAAPIRMCANVPAGDLLQQFASRYAPVLQNRIPLLQQQATSVQLASNVPPFPGASVNSVGVGNTTGTPSGDLGDNNPFRQVQWIPPAIHVTGVPQVPFAVEIKPQTDDTPQDHDTFVSAPAVNDANYGMEGACEQPLPTVYLDIAMDGSSQCLDANKGTVDKSSAGSAVIVMKSAEKSGKRKSEQCESRSGVKILKLLEKHSVKPCVVSLVPIDGMAVNRPECNSVEQVCVEADTTAAISVDELEENPTVEEFGAADNQAPCVISSVPTDHMVDDGPESNVVEEECVDAKDVASCPEDNSTMEELDTPENQETRECGTPATSVSKEQELSSNLETPMSGIQQSAREGDSDQLIGSDEDVGEDDPPHDGDDRLPDEGGISESACYEIVSTKSDALLFDMECDGQKDGETLRVLLPTKKSKGPKKKSKLTSTALPPPTTTVLPTSRFNLLNMLSSINKAKKPVKKSGLAKSKVSHTKNASVSKQLHKNPTTVEKIGEIVSIDTDTDNSDDDVVVAAEVSASKSVVNRSQRYAASACLEKMSASISRLETIEIKRSENALLGVPLQSSFFRFEAQSSEVFRLLAMERTRVPRDVLAELSDLVDGTTDDKQPSFSDVSDHNVGRVPRGESRSLLFQCLFCPYGEMSAKRIMAHVKQQHGKYASFVQRSLLPSRQMQLHIYCRHCNFVAYDSAAMFIHFAVYHKVAGILLSQPRDIEQDPDWAPMINPDSNAQQFPFYCCPNCVYIDAEWNRMIEHMLRRHASESAVFLGCAVRLIMVGRASKHLSSFSYRTLASQKLARKEIYACVSCRFFSFYPTYAFCHYVVSHCNLELLYMCAASPSCSKRYTSVEDVLTHIQGSHVTMRVLQCQCTATVMDSLMSSEVDVRAGQLTTADVPVHVNYGVSSAFIRKGSVATIEIGDDDNDSDEDVVVLRPEDCQYMTVSVIRESTRENSPDQLLGSDSELGTDDHLLCSDSDCLLVEPEPLTSNECTDIPSASILSEKSNPTEQDVSKQEPHNSCPSSQPEAIEVADDSDDSDDTVVLSPAHSDKSDDVEPDLDEGSNCASVLAADEPSEESHPTEENVSTQEARELDCRYPDDTVSEQTAEQCSGNDTEPDVNHTVEKTVASDNHQALSEHGIDATSASEAQEFSDDTIPAIQESERESNSDQLIDSDKDAEADGPLLDDNNYLLNEDGISEKSAYGEDTVSTTEAEDTESKTMESVCSGEDEYVTEPVCDPNIETGIHVEDESSKTEFCDSHSGKTEEVLGGIGSQAVCSSSNSLTGLVDSTADSACQSSDAYAPVDCAAGVADNEVNHTSLPANDESITETETSRAESVDSADSLASRKDTDQFTDSTAASATTAPSNDEDATVLAVRRTPDAMSQEVVHDDMTVSEVNVARPQLNNACIVEPPEEELFNFSEPDGIDNCLGFDDDTFSSFEFPESPTSTGLFPCESRECPMLDAEEQLLLLSDQLTADLPQSGRHCGSAEDVAPACCVVSSADIINSDTVDDPAIVSKENPCLALFCQHMSEGAVCSSVGEKEQFDMSVDSLPCEADSVQERDIQMAPYCADSGTEVSPRSGDSSLGERTDSPSEQSAVSNSADKPCTVNQSRFKTLAGFRFTSPCSFDTKPS